MLVYRGDPNRARLGAEMTGNRRERDIDGGECWTWKTLAHLQVQVWVPRHEMPDRGMAMAMAVVAMAMAMAMAMWRRKEGHEHEGVERLGRYEGIQRLPGRRRATLELEGEKRA